MKKKSRDRIAITKYISLNECLVTEMPLFLFGCQMFLSAHYAGEDIVLKLQPNEAWKKVVGPVFLYLNTLVDGEDSLWLWEDAKDQVRLA